MNLLYRHEYLSCLDYNQPGKPMIEVLKMAKGEKKSLFVTNNEFVFIVEGKVEYHFKELPSCVAIKGQLMFHPVGEDYSFDSVENSMIIIFRVHNPLSLCNLFTIEKLYGIKEIIPRFELEKGTEERARQVGVLEITPRIWNFLLGVIDCVEDGIKCRCWYELKIKELMILLRGHYTKERLHDFFMTILSENPSFSEYVRLNWLNLLSVQKFAESLHLTPKQFSTRFIRVFGKTPIRWISEKRAQKAYSEITLTKRPFKQISSDCGFNSDTEFTRFCKKELGKTPTELREEAMGV